MNRSEYDAHRLGKAAAAGARTVRAVADALCMTRRGAAILLARGKRRGWVTEVGAMPVRGHARKVYAIHPPPVEQEPLTVLEAVSSVLESGVILTTSEVQAQVADLCSARPRSVYTALAELRELGGLENYGREGMELLWGLPISQRRAS